MDTIKFTFKVDTIQPDSRNYNKIICTPTEDLFIVIPVPADKRFIANLADIITGSLYAEKTKPTLTVDGLAYIEEVLYNRSSKQADDVAYTDRKSVV